MTKRNQAQSLIGVVQGSQIGDVDISLRAELAFVAFPPQAHPLRQQCRPTQAPQRPQERWTPA